MHQAPDGETINVGGLGVRFLVESTDSNGSAAVFECYVPANARMPAPHSHDAFEETIYGLEGATTWTIAGRTVQIGPGEAVAIASPAAFGPAYFREIGEVLAAGAGGPPDVAAIGEVMRRHGLTPAAPSAS